MNEEINSKWIMIIFWGGVSAGYLSLYLLSVIIGDLHRLETIAWSGGLVCAVLCLVLFYLDFVRDKNDY